VKIQAPGKAGKEKKLISISILFNNLRKIRNLLFFPLAFPANKSFSHVHQNVPQGSFGVTKE
jgi:hypothetical protein